MEAYPEDSRRGAPFRNAHRFFEPTGERDPIVIPGDYSESSSVNAVTLKAMSSAKSCPFACAVAGRFDSAALQYKLFALPVCI